MQLLSQTSFDYKPPGGRWQHLHVARRIFGPDSDPELWEDLAAVRLDAVAKLQAFKAARRAKIEQDGYDAAAVELTPSGQGGSSRQPRPPRPQQPPPEPPSPPPGAEEVRQEDARQISSGPAKGWALCGYRNKAGELLYAWRKPGGSRWLEREQAIKAASNAAWQDMEMIREVIRKRMMTEYGPMRGTVTSLDVGDDDADDANDLVEEDVDDDDGASLVAPADPRHRMPPRRFQGRGGSAQFQQEEMEQEEEDLVDENQVDMQQFSRVVTRQAARGWGLRLLVMGTGQTRWLVKPPGTKRWLPDQRVIMQGPGAVDVSVAAALASEKAMLLAQVGVKRLVAAPQPAVRAPGMDPAIARRRAIGMAEGWGHYGLRGTALSEPSVQDTAARYSKKRRAMAFSSEADVHGHAKRRAMTKTAREPFLAPDSDLHDGMGAAEALDIESSEYGSPYAEPAAIS